jgi:hypothetical protein
MTDSRNTLEKVLMLGLELKMAYDLPNDECIKQALKEAESQ